MFLQRSLLPVALPECTHLCSAQPHRLATAFLPASPEFTGYSLVFTAGSPYPAETRVVACSPAFLKGFKVFKGLLLKTLNDRCVFRKMRTARPQQAPSAVSANALLSRLRSAGWQVKANLPVNITLRR